MALGGRSIDTYIMRTAERDHSTVGKGMMIIDLASGAEAMTDIEVTI